MLQRILVTGITFFCLQLGMAQQTATTVAIDSTSKPVAEPKPTTVISGFADAYYRYDAAKTPFNNRTSFTNSHNSFELGMISAKVDQSFGRAAMTADLGFGRRAEEFSYTDANTRFIIKQLFLSYNFKHDVKVTAGSWATHVGYEVVDAYVNRNYSMSYMFSYGPFFHTGVKVEKTFGRIGTMLGLSNPTDLKSANFSNKYLIGQVSASDKDGKLKAYLNFQVGKPSDSTQYSQVDLVATYAISDKFSLGLNSTMANIQQKNAESDGFAAADHWWGSALYINVNPSSWLGLTLRSEYFSDKKQLNVFTVAPSGGGVLANTLSLNLTKDHITLIPEIRYEKANQELFLDKEGLGTKSAFSFLCAVVYKF
jgi:hypothetical protein